MQAEVAQGYTFHEDAYLWSDIVMCCECKALAINLQVIEARNLSVPSDLLHTFYTMDSYSVVSCTSEAGVTSHHTKIERNNLQPHWNERCTFDDVALSNSLTVAIFDHKKLSSDVFLGHVSPEMLAYLLQPV